MTQEYTEEIHCEYDWGERRPSEAVLETIAVYEETDPADVLGETGEPLHHYIDTEALDTTVLSSDDLSLSFTYSGYAVLIEGETIQVTSF